VTKTECYQRLEAAVRDGVVPARRGGHRRCLYRGDNGTRCAIGLLIPDDNGTRCAIGLLIPDDKYLLEMENSRVDRLMESLPGVVEEVEGMTPADYRALQSAHDHAVNFLEPAGGRAEFSAWSPEKFLADARGVLGVA